MIKYSCSRDNHLTEILVDNILEDISINLQNKNSVVKEVKDDFELSR